jgi:hypothetical protein
MAKASWFKRIFSVNPDWTDSLLSPSYRPRIRLSAEPAYTPPPLTDPHQYHVRDTRRNLPPTVVISTKALIGGGKGKVGRRAALAKGISPGPPYQMTISEEQSPGDGFFTLTNYK